MHSIVFVTCGHCNTAFCCLFLIYGYIYIVFYCLCHKVTITLSSTDLVSFGRSCIVFQQNTEIHYIYETRLIHRPVISQLIHHLYNVHSSKSHLLQSPERCNLECRTEQSSLPGFSRSMARGQESIFFSISVHPISLMSFMPGIKKTHLFLHPAAS